MRSKRTSPLRLRGAAACGAVALRVRPQLERDRDRVVAALERRLRRHRAVHAAAHRDERAAAARLEPDRAAGGGSPDRRVQGVRRQVGGVELARRQPAELVRDVVRRDARGGEHRRVLHELDDCAAGSLRGAAAERVEAGLGHAVALDPQRDPHEVAAGRAAGRAGVRRAGQAAASAGRVEVIVEGTEQGRSDRKGAGRLSLVGAHQPQKGLAPACRCRLGVEPAFASWVPSEVGHGLPRVRLPSQWCWLNE
jgi:hypothetical protein